MSAGHHPSQHPNLKPEPDNLPIGFLAAFIIAILSVMVFVALIARQLLYTATQYQIEAVDTGVPNRALGEHRVQEDEILGNYEAVDKAAGTYRIPIAQAIDAYVAKVVQ